MWFDPSVILNSLLVLFNGVLAYCTWQLVSSTNKLWSAADEQSRLTRQSIELARSEFLATHRPRLRARVVRLSGVGVESLKLQYSVINVGETPATIVRHETKIIAEDDTSVLRTRPDKQDCVTLAAGEAKAIAIQAHFDLESGHGPEYDTSFHVRSGGTVKFRGIIEYVDGADIKRRTGFLRTYNSETQCFDANSDPNEEYED